MILTKKEILYIAENTDVFDDQNNLSLLSSITEKPDGTERDKLEAKGILKKEEYDPPLMEHLKVVAKPDHVSRLMLNNGFSRVERYTYRKDDLLILVEVDPEGLKFSQPSSISDSVLSLFVFLGLSPITYTSFTLSLTKDEGLLLAALVDIYRKHELAAYLGEGEELVSISLAEIENEIAKGSKVGLLAVLYETYDFEPLTPDLIETTAESLIEKELVVNQNGLLLSDMLSMFAKSFLIPGCFVTFDTFSTTSDEEIGYVGNICVSAGLHNLVVFSYDGAVLEMTTLSSVALLKKIEEYMRGPKLEKIKKSTAEKTEVTASEKKLQDKLKATGSAAGISYSPRDSTPGTEDQKWYISRGEEQYGPYTEEDMISFARQGNLDPEDLVWSEDTGDWVRADSVSIFFAQ
jgi:hypothetical protein